MYYRKTISFIFILILSTHFYSQGDIFSENFDQINKKLKTVELQATRSPLKPSHTLEKFLHYVHQQEGSSCSAHAFTTCRTILYARDNNITEVNKISFESFSPYYTYLSCKEPNGTMMSRIESINSKGFYKIKDFEFPNYYPFSNKNIIEYSYLSDLKNEAINHKFSDWERIDLKKSPKEKVAQIKQELSSNKPAFVSFYWDMNKGGPVKGNDPNVIGHSVTLIGYDDDLDGGSLLYFNSHGEDFGENGKMWITYKKFFQCARLILFFDTEGKIDVSSNQNIKIKDGSNIKASKIKEVIKPLSFDWSIKMPILNSLGTYIGDTNSLGQRNGNGEFKADNSATYNGNWKDDAPYGNGTAELNEEIKYKANWKNEFELPEFYESVYSSVFKYKGSDKYVKEYYVGGFKGALSSENFHGKGVLKYGGNIVYEGEWINGEKSGKGTYYGQFNDGSKYKYVGEWLNNKENGKGVIYLEDGSIYQEGLYKNGDFVK
jgi:regulation of enolase protein 1 (concanavalin A-like superfamily)